MMWKKLVVLGMVFLMVLPVGAACAKGQWDVTNVVYREGEVECSDLEQEAGNPIFQITMEDGGVIRGELYPDIAPQAVGNFIALANSGFYDGLIFHRVIPGFMIQGGRSTGAGNPGWNIKGEFQSNGVENSLIHTRGVLSMARVDRQYDSASSQFFIMVTYYPSLNGEYAAFGKVLEGLEVVDDIVKAERDKSDKPLKDQVMKTVRVETFGQEYLFDKL